MKGQPKLHPRGALGDLCHVPTHGARHSDRLTHAEPLQMHANVSAGRGVWQRAPAGGDRTGGATVPEEDDEILCQVEREVLA